MKPIITLLIAAALAAGCGTKTQEAAQPQTGANAEAQGEHGEESETETETLNARVGPGLAVEGYEVETGRIKLSQKAVERLGLRSERAAFRDGALRIPSAAVGDEAGEPFVYAQEKDGWMKRVYVITGPASGRETPVLKGLAAGTPVVTEGASLVRLAELDILAGDAVASCCVH